MSTPAPVTETETVEHLLGGISSTFRISPYTGAVK